MPNKLDNITVVIRSVDEATISLCKAIVLKEVDKENIHLICEKPFYNAVKKTFEIGLEKNKKWTVAIDADLLLMPRALSVMTTRAALYDKNDELYVYQGKILDKFRGATKSGGPHLYKTNKLQEALKYVESSLSNLRPESRLYKIMQQKQLAVVEEKRLFALHDFYQSPKDIYRKAFFHGIKHKGYKSLIPNWIEDSKLDVGMKFAVYGYLEGYYKTIEDYPSMEYIDNKWNRQKELLSMASNNETTKLPETLTYNDILNKYHYKINENLEFSSTKKNRRSLISRLRNLFR